MDSNVAIEKFGEKLDDIKERLIVIETQNSTQIVQVNQMAVKLEAVEKTANEALQSTRSAHKRMDKSEDHVTWIWRTIFGGFITGMGVFLLYLARGGKW